MTMRDASAWILDLKDEELLILVAAIGLVVFIFWGPKLLGAMVTFHEWLGEKLREQQNKKRSDGEDE